MLIVKLTRRLQHYAEEVYRRSGLRESECGDDDENKPSLTKYIVRSSGDNSKRYLPAGGKLSSDHLPAQWLIVWRLESRKDQWCGSSQYPSTNWSQIVTAAGAEYAT